MLLRNFRYVMRQYSKTLCAVNILISNCTRLETVHLATVRLLLSRLVTRALHSSTRRLYGPTQEKEH